MAILEGGGPLLSMIPSIFLKFYPGIYSRKGDRPQEVYFLREEVRVVVVRGVGALILQRCLCTVFPLAAGRVFFQSGHLF